jgi:hypothetical protein
MSPFHIMGKKHSHIYLVWYSPWVGDIPKIWRRWSKSPYFENACTQGLYPTPNFFYCDETGVLMRCLLLKSARDGTPISEHNCPPTLSP